jgi:hypothetical protein
LSKNDSLKLGVWLEQLSDVPGPRIKLIHNFLSPEELKHLMALGKTKGMHDAAKFCKRCHPGWRTNTAAWLEVINIEILYF